MNLSGVREGTETFDEFARRTEAEFRKLATYICRRVAPHASVYVEDAMQELLVETWISVKKWDPNRGVALEKYCLFGALSAVKRKLRGQRSDPLSVWNTRSRREKMRRRLVDNQTVGAEVRMTVERACERSSQEERTALVAVLQAEGNVAEAARAIQREARVGKNGARARAREAKARLLTELST